MSSLSWRLRFVVALAASATFRVDAHAQTTYDWDNYSGDSQWTTRINWNPYPLPPAAPGALDTAVFDGLLAGAGVGNNAVQVPSGTAIMELRIVDSAIVDLTIGDGTTASRLDLDRTAGDSLLLGDFNSTDTATLTLNGGWLDTFQATISARTAFTLINPGTYWDSTTVRVSGDNVPNAAGIGLGLGAQVSTHGDLVMGGFERSSRVVVDGTTSGFAPPSSWTISGSVLVGYDGAADFSRDLLTLLDGGRMTVANDVLLNRAAGLTKATVQSGGQLDVGDLLQIGPYATLELSDANSKIRSGYLAKTGTGGAFDWTAGTLEIASGQLYLDSVTPDSVFGQSLTVGAGKTLRVLNTVWEPVFRVGNDGVGSLSITGGGVVDSYHLLIGVFSGSNGTATVSGAGSQLNVTEDLVVGTQGTGLGRLDLLGGGHVSANSVYLGRGDSASGIATVDGASSTLTSTAVVAVGGFLGDDASAGEVGGSGRLTVQNGGKVDVATAMKVWDRGTLELLGGEIRTRALAIVPGGSFRHDDGVLTIDGGEFDPVDGNYSINGRRAGQLPQLVVKNGGSAVVAPAAWPTGTLFVGYDHAGRMEVRAGSSVTSYNGRIAFQSSGAGSVLVDGANARWMCTTDLEVATGGNGDLTIAIAASPGSSGLVSVSGGGRWHCSDTLYVGGKFTSGGNGVLAVQAGGQVETPRLHMWHNGTATNYVGGATTIGAGPAVVGEVSIYTGGKLEGHGSVIGAVVNRGGTVEPGTGYSDHGSLSIAGSYVQSSGSLVVDLAGTSGSTSLKSPVRRLSAERSAQCSGRPSCSRPAIGSRSSRRPAASQGDSLTRRRSPIRCRVWACTSTTTRSPRRCL
jgi:T5SS/PEP-CTERM-associated repeat protein